MNARKLAAAEQKMLGCMLKLDPKTEWSTDDHESNERLTNKYREPNSRQPEIEIDDTRTLDRIQHVDLFPETTWDANLKRLLQAINAAVSG